MVRKAKEAVPGSTGMVGSMVGVRLVRIATVRKFELLEIFTSVYNSPCRIERI
jgi:hypothetical protein